MSIQRNPSTALELIDNDPAVHAAAVEYREVVDRQWLSKILCTFALPQRIPIGFGSGEITGQQGIGRQIPRFDRFGHPLKIQGTNAVQFRHQQQIVRAESRQVTVGIGSGQQGRDLIHHTDEAVQFGGFVFWHRGVNRNDSGGAHATGYVHR